jgi:hypothetical protein
MVWAVLGIVCFFASHQSSAGEYPSVQLPKSVSQRAPSSISSPDGKIRRGPDGQMEMLVQVKKRAPTKTKKSNLQEYQKALNR